METVTVRKAQPSDAAIVQEMLHEAARWVDALGVVMWDEGELAPGRVDGEIAAGQFFIAEVNGDPAGAIKFQLEDTTLLAGPDRRRLRVHSSSRRSPPV